MTFLGDMGISPRTIEFLKQQGYDAIHLHQEGLDTLPDAEILRKARQENRILLTHDLDFGELLAASGARLPSVIIFRLRNMRPAQVNQVLSVIGAEYATVLQTGCILSVTEHQIRVRPLPVKSK
jgi:predicted nuclease of predicted toxin-antitoxin system